ncbi:MAG: AAA family ATPase [Saprospiraceae bacterium]
MVKFLKRSIFDRLQELLGFFPIVGIVGARQVGKTTLAKIFSEDSVYLDLEDDRDRAKLQNDPLYFFQQYSDRTVILDEVQLMPEISRALRGVIDADRRPGRFILLGSASPVLLKQTSESLAGRIATSNCAHSFWGN